MLAQGDGDDGDTGPQSLVTAPRTRQGLRTKMLSATQLRNTKDSNYLPEKNPHFIKHNQKQNFFSCLSFLDLDPVRCRTPLHLLNGLGNKKTVQSVSPLSIPELLPHQVTTVGFSSSILMKRQSWSSIVWPCTQGSVSLFFVCI